jgi:hypothetical protein
MDVVRLLRLSGAGWVGIDHHTGRTGAPDTGKRCKKLKKCTKKVSWSGWGGLDIGSGAQFLSDKHIYNPPDRYFWGLFSGYSLL